MTKRLRLKPERVRINPKAAKQAKTPPRNEKRQTRAKLPRESRSDPTEGDYTIGRGKPPKHTQFRKGDGRKRPGRKKGSKNLRTIIMEAVNDPVTVTVEGKTRKISKLQATAMQLATKAATGNDRAIAKLLDWVDEIEARAEAARPAEYPFSDADITVIRQVYKRLRPYDERAND